MLQYDDSLLSTSELDECIASLEQSNWPPQPTELLWEGVQRCRGAQAEQRAPSIARHLSSDAVQRLLASKLGAPNIRQSQILALQLCQWGLHVATGWRVTLADGTRLHELLAESDADDPTTRLSRMALLGMAFLNMRNRPRDVPAY